MTRTSTAPAVSTAPGRIDPVVAVTTTRKRARPATGRRATRTEYGAPSIARTALNGGLQSPVRGGWSTSPSPLRASPGSCVVLTCSRETGRDQVMLIAVRASVVYDDDSFRRRTRPSPLWPKRAWSWSALRIGARQRQACGTFSIPPTGPGWLRGRRIPDDRMRNVPYSGRPVPRRQSKSPGACTLGGRPRGAVSPGALSKRCRRSGKTWASRRRQSASECRDMRMPGIFLLPHNTAAAVALAGGRSRQADLERALAPSK
jgi:hypothetical protein